MKVSKICKMSAKFEVVSKIHLPSGCPNIEELKAQHNITLSTGALCKGIKDETQR